MRAADIRRTFLEFFREREHRVVPSSSLVPDDPTLLLTTAGMVQFKPFFLGRRRPEYRRATSCQKSARTTDIENVGRTARHLTFFEMLGNFSFGDYFKREACSWAWQLVTEGFGLAADRLWVTIYETDDEAAEVWRDVVGVKEERIVRRGFDDNFWWMGVPGPCGPCSEIFYDRGERYGHVEGFQDGDRIIEIWNLVFMQSVCDERGAVVGELPSKNIDTGMGLERMAAVLQDVPSAYETDVLRPIVARVEGIAGRAYGEAEKADVSLRIVAEHARTATFLIGDGVFPSNEDRGYVLRRLIRRAVRHAKILGVDEPIMPAMTETVIATMADAYPNLAEDRSFIVQVASQEEEHFRQTLGRGLALLDQEVSTARAAGAARLAGDVAFRLHDTYGFPRDLTLEIAAEAGLEVDLEEFERLMDEQRERSRVGGLGKEADDASALREILAEHGGSKFLGYEQDAAEATVVGLVRDGARVPSAGEGDEVEVVLDATPFYPEGGGQVGDAGRIAANGAELEILDTKRALDELIVHRAKVVRGEVAAGATAHAAVDPARRAATMRSHTATHLLHWALRETLGAHARQAGSLVAPGRLRFDFPHFEAVPREMLERMEDLVNARLAADDAVRPYETTMEEARARGALMLFEEKYGDIVRVVEIDGYSIELCGGTHCARTGQVGVFKLLGEGSIGSNLRRIEALTGPDALEGFRREQYLLEQVAQALKVRPEEAPDRVRKVVEDLRRAEEGLRKAQAGAQRERAGEIAAGARRVGRADLVVAEVPGLRVDELQKLAVAVREAAGPESAVVLASSAEGRAGIVAAVSKGLGVAGRALVEQAARAIGGGAGGKNEVATGGGNRPEGLAEALRLAEAAARDLFGRPA